LDDDLIGVAIGQEPGERAAPGHPVAAGIVDDDEVDAARLLAFGRQAGAGAAADDRLAPRDHRLEPVEDVLAGYARHGPYSAATRDCASAISRKFAANASANAGSLMCSGRRTSLRLAAGRKACSSAVNSARSAAGSQKG